MKTLAGVTAMVNSVNPMPAIRRVRLIVTPAAPSNSNTPLTMHGQEVGRARTAARCCTNDGMRRKWHIAADREP